MTDPTGRTAASVTKSTDWPKELVAAMLAIAIVGLTLCLLWKMFNAPDEPNWEHRSSIVQVCLALAGTVTGYYFGRIPAERAAASANQASAANASRAADAVASRNQVLGQLKGIRTQLQPGGSPMGGGPNPSATVDEVRAEVVRRIDQILGGR